MKTKVQNKHYEFADGLNVIVYITNPDGMTVKQMAALMEKEVEEKGFLGIPLFSVKGLEMFGAAFNKVYAKRQYRHTIIMFGELRVTAVIVYGEEVWNDKEELALAKRLVTAATLDSYKSMSSKC